MSATHAKLPALVCSCAWCGRWRDAARRWHHPADQPQPPARVTHGICPACFAAQGGAGDDPPSPDDTPPTPLR